MPETVKESMALPSPALTETVCPISLSVSRAIFEAISAPRRISRSPAFGYAPLTIQ